jgi:hypothetical protein
MHLVLIAWIYVALMMALAEATHPQGSILGAIFTFFLYGVGPAALVLYLMGAPGRRRAIKAREAAQAAAPGPTPVPTPGRTSVQPDGGNIPAGATEGNLVAPVRKEH